MNQPPRFTGPSGGPATWRRPRGVAAGTWEYVHQRSIADRYDEFVAETPLCAIDLEALQDTFPAPESPRREPPPVVLDLGCGTGRAALPLARRGYRVVAIDLSEPMLRVLRQKVDGEKVDGESERARETGRDSNPGNRVTPAPGGPPPVVSSGAGTIAAGTIAAVRANLVELDGFADDTADDAVCLFSTLGMIRGRIHRLEMLRHVARIVRPGGRLLVHAHNRWASLHEPGGIRRLAASWIRSRVSSDHEFGDATYGYRGLPQMFLHRYSWRQLVVDLDESGWRLVDQVPLSLDGSERRGLGWPPHPRCGGFLVTAVRRASQRSGSH